jgi:hypothetical protein
MLKPAVLVPLALCLSMFVCGPVARGAQQDTAAKSTAGVPDLENAPWAHDIAKRHEELIARNGPGTDAVLRDTLLAMNVADQNARGMSTGHPTYTAKTAEADNQLTEQLKAIAAKSGWPTIAMVGYEASNDAMTILTHTPDHAWQLSLLPQLEELADTGKIDGSTLAFVIDKELVSEGKLQRYGTQFKFVDGQMAMFGVEDPSALDARRAKAFLMPIEVYKQYLEQGYHLQVSNKVVSASTPK